VDADDPSVEDDSCRLLLDAMEWKVQFPEQVHFLLGNHDLAQLTGREITKSGGASIAAFNRWVAQQFAGRAEEVLEALGRLLMSLPLAARTPNRIWMSHSLPGPYAFSTFDLSIFSRDWRPADLLPGGSVYELVWGRAHTAAHMEMMAELLGVDIFIVGHQGQPDGFEYDFDRLIILASDHAMGCFAAFDLSRPLDFDDLIDRIRYFYQVLPSPRPEMQTE
jgi:hypothetical protein